MLEIINTDENNKSTITQIGKEISLMLSKVDKLETEKISIGDLSINPELIESNGFGKAINLDGEKIKELELRINSLETSVTNLINRMNGR